MTRFNILLMDIPLKYNDRNNSDTKFGKGANRYAHLTPKDMFDLRIDKLAADNCALLLWATAPKMREYDYMRLMEHWGFRYATKIFCWVKIDKLGNPRYLPGYYTGSNTEDCYLGIRGEQMQTIIDDTVDCYLGVKGSMPPANRGVNQVIFAPITEHSEKPVEQYARIDQLFGTERSRLEIFARKKMPGWDATGLELDGKDIRRINDENFREL